MKRITNVEKVANWIEGYMATHKAEIDEIKRVYQTKNYHDILDGLFMEFSSEGWIEILKQCEIKSFKEQHIYGLNKNFIRLENDVINELEYRYWFKFK